MRTAPCIWSCQGKNGGRGREAYPGIPGKGTGNTRTITVKKGSLAATKAGSREKRRTNIERVQQITDALEIVYDLLYTCKQDDTQRGYCLRRKQ